MEAGVLDGNVDGAAGKGRGRLGSVARWYRKEGLERGWLRGRGKGTARWLDEGEGEHLGG